MLCIPKEEVLALIPARGGSKGLPRKNVLVAGGRPLIGWTIAAAQGSQVVGTTVLTSDDEEIMTAARACGCAVPFRRPEHLASDTASTMDVVFHALDQLPQFEYLVLLQPTSPLRTATDIDAAFDLMIRCNAPSCVSVADVEQSPYWMYRVGEDDRLDAVLPPPEGITRRQDLPPVYTLNGAIYIARIDWLRHVRSFVSAETVGYRMPIERSIDIDTREDFDKFRNIVERKM
ncbi:cytidylyltransferase domain-containing protein [Massilia sp. CT11-137]|jgi:N-acylneuraminate cytidylyltransferase|uniref:acylneuraminate cytidylyltransferase family protein n=1 Tax=Massilia sp. CT11-137 TaxID=3393901 RepID=UPI0039A42238